MVGSQILPFVQSILGGTQARFVKILPSGQTHDLSVLFHTLPLLQGFAIQ